MQRPFQRSQVVTGLAGALNVPGGLQHMNFDDTLQLAVEALRLDPSPYLRLALAGASYRAKGAVLARNGHVYATPGPTKALQVEAAIIANWTAAAQQLIAVSLTAANLGTLDATSNGVNFSDISNPIQGAMLASIARTADGAGVIGAQLFPIGIPAGETVIVPLTPACPILYGVGDPQQSYLASGGGFGIANGTANEEIRVGLLVREWPVPNPQT